MKMQPSQARSPRRSEGLELSFANIYLLIRMALSSLIIFQTMLLSLFWNLKYSAGCSDPMHLYGYLLMYLDGHLSVILLWLFLWINLLVQSSVSSWSLDTIYDILVLSSAYLWNSNCVKALIWQILYFPVIGNNMLCMLFFLQETALFTMDPQHRSNTRKWNIVCWNIRGINSQKKWNAIRSKIAESNCDIICFQETKREFFDAAYIKKFCPPQFDSYEFLPSIGQSGGILVVWKGNKFLGNKLYMNEFAISVEFIQWLHEIEMPDDTDWLLMGDFNLITSQEDRNRPGGNVNEMFAFNEVISQLGLVELPLKGKMFTWTNNQQSPLLEKLDWFFISNS